ncbi:MAG: RDD family protein [Lapillicoccus sp.]
MSQQPPPVGPQDTPPSSPPYAPPPPPAPAPYAPYASAPHGPGASPYAGAPYAPTYQPPAYSPYAVETYAHWGRRVGALLLDSLLTMPGWLLAVIGFVMLGAGSGSRTRTGNTAVSGVGVVLVLVGYALMIGITIWNRYVRAGRTGQSWGKKVLGIRLVREVDGRPIGAWLAFGRDLAHTVDGFFYLGYLWPLWDPKRQTFADKICSTVVLAR